jgi:Neuraminidase (sialidase)
MMRFSRKIVVSTVLALVAIPGSPFLTAQMTPRVEKRVIVATDGGYFPVLLRLQTGRLLVVYRYGAPHISVKGELAVSWSDDNGQTWTSPKVVVTGENDHRNPAMGEMQNGDIVLSYCIMDGYDASGRKFKPPVNGMNQRSSRPLWMVRSRDHGVTWDAPEEIEGTRAIADKGELINAYGKIVLTRDGSALMSVYGTSKVHSPSYEYIFKSTNMGHTWSLLSTVAEQVNETGILALPGKQILATMRTNKEQELTTTRSVDGGKTWDTPIITTNANEHPGDLIRLRNGDILLTFGERNVPRGAAAMLSQDGGKTWDQHTRMVLADDAPIFDCGYPSSVELPDGRIVTVYYKVDDSSTAPASTKLTAVIWRLPR